MSMMNRILAPVDFSPSSAGATRYARSLAMHLGCELTLVHVLELTQFEYSPIQPINASKVLREGLIRRSA